MTRGSLRFLANRSIFATALFIAIAIAITFTFTFTIAAPGLAVASSDFDSIADEFLEEGRALLARYAVPSKSLNLLPPVVTSLRSMNSARAAENLLTLYAENRKRLLKLNGRTRSLARSLHEKSAGPRALKEQVRRDLIRRSLDIASEQRATVGEMEGIILSGLAGLSDSDALVILRERIRRGGDANLMQALAAPLVEARDRSAAADLIRALSACKKGATTPLYEALEQLTGQSLPRRLSPWKEWWSKQDTEGVSK